MFDHHRRRDLGRFIDQNDPVVQDQGQGNGLICLSAPDKIPALEWRNFSRSGKSLKIPTIRCRASSLSLNMARRKFSSTVQRIDDSKARNEPYAQTGDFKRSAALDGLSGKGYRPARGRAKAVVRKVVDFPAPVPEGYDAAECGYAHL